MTFQRQVGSRNVNNEKIFSRSTLAIGLLSHSTLTISVRLMVELLVTYVAADGWAEVLLPPAANDDEKGGKYPLLVHA